MLFPLIDELATTDIVRVSAGVAVSDALKQMSQHKVRNIVIEEAAGGFGLMTAPDLVRLRFSLPSLDVAISDVGYNTLPLTGAANRTRFEELLLSEQHRHSRSPETPFSVILLDIDHFKQINDTWGHNQGDIVLKGFAQHIQNQLRHNDTLARWGGEEFAVLLPHTNLDAARSVAEKICQSLAVTAFDQVGQVTASLGVALYRPGETGSELLGRADDALYRAKRNGRNRVEMCRR